MLLEEGDKSQGFRVAAEREMHDRFIIVFSTGRSGTALLAQYFGGLFSHKGLWKMRNGTAIAHEPFDEMKRYWEVVDNVKKGLESSFVRDILRPSLKSLGECDQFLITDNKIGRWFLSDFMELGIETRVIYLYRHEEAVVKSMRKFCRRWGTRWCHELSDADNLVHRRLDPYWYHVKETQARWSKAKERLDIKQYIEVSFESFLADRRRRSEVEAFVGLMGYEDMMKIRVNVSENRTKELLLRLAAFLKRSLNALV